MKVKDMKKLLRKLPGDMDVVMFLNGDNSVVVNVCEENSMVINIEILDSGIVDVLVLQPCTCESDNNTKEGDVNSRPDLN